MPYRANGSGEDLEIGERYAAVGTHRIDDIADGRRCVPPRHVNQVDVAEKVHRDFVANLKYARIWGEGKTDGIMVPRDFVIDDGDVLELHV